MTAKASSSPLQVLRLAPQTKRIELDGDLAGGWVEVVLNPPSHVIDVFQTEARANRAATPDAPYYPSPEYRPAVAALLKAWNLADAEGTPLPPTAESLALLHWDVTHAVMGAWNQAASLPKSSATTPATSSAA